MPMPVVQRLFVVAVLSGFGGIASASGPPLRTEPMPSRLHSPGSAAKLSTFRLASPGFDINRFITFPSRRGGRPTSLSSPNPSAVPTRLETTEAEPSAAPTPTPVGNPMANLLPPVPPAPVKPSASKSAPVSRWGLGVWLTVGLTGCFSLVLLVGVTLLAWPTRRLSVPRYRRSRPLEDSASRSTV